MRCRLLLLCLTLLGAGLSGGCALVGDACAAPVTGTATYVSGSTPPPYHHEWTVQLEATSGSITYTPGYDSDEGWTEAFVPDTEAVVRACGRLREEGDSGTAPGGGTLTVRWCGDGGRWTRLQTSSADVADVVRAAVPADAWSRAEDAYLLWQQTHRR